MSTSTTVFGSTASPGSSGTTLTGKWLAIARMGWLGAFLLVCFIVLRGLPLRHDQALSGATSLLVAHAEWQYKISANRFAFYALALDCCTVAVFIGAAILIFKRKSDDWFGIFTSLTLLLFGVSVNGIIFALPTEIPSLTV